MGINAASKQQILDAVATIRTAAQTIQRTIPLLVEEGSQQSTWAKMATNSLGRCVSAVINTLSSVEVTINNLERNLRMEEQKPTNGITSTGEGPSPGITRIGGPKR